MTEAKATGFLFNCAMCGELTKDEDGTIGGEPMRADTDVSGLCSEGDGTSASVPRPTLEKAGLSMTAEATAARERFAVCPGEEVCQSEGMLPKVQHPIFGEGFPSYHDLAHLFAEQAREIERLKLRLQDSQGDAADA